MPDYSRHGVAAGAIVSDSPAPPSWKPAALFALACLLIVVGIAPLALAGHGHLKGMLPVVQGVFLVGTLVFGLLAFVRYTTQAHHGAAPLPQFMAPLSEFVMPLSEFVSERREPAGRVVPFPVAHRDIADRPSRWSLDVIDRMEWKRFEDVCCAFYNEKGIKAATTRMGADGGVDIRLYQDPDDADCCTAIVQCKAWGQPVGVKTMRELRGVMAHEAIERAFFMAPNGFTDNAREFAAINRITLLDGRLILAMIQRLPDDASRRLLELATEGDWTTPTCPSCGASMTPRQGKHGPFWGCSTYPRCRAKLGMRGVGPARHAASA